MTSPTQSPLESLIFHTLETLTAQEQRLAQHYSKSGQTEPGVQNHALVGEILNLRHRAERLNRMMDAMNGMYTYDLASNFKTALAMP